MTIAKQFEEMFGTPLPRYYKELWRRLGSAKHITDAMHHAKGWLNNHPECGVADALHITTDILKKDNYKWRGRDIG